MKTNAIRILALGAVCVYGSALDAQSHNLSATIPFAFQAADKAFPAGKYVVTENGMAGVPTLKNVKTGNAVFIAGASHSLDPVRPGRLVFHCYSTDGCFLAEIWPVTGYGSTVAKTKAEKEILKGDRPHEMATISIGLHPAD